MEQPTAEPLAGVMLQEKELRSPQPDEAELRPELRALLLSFVTLVRGAKESRADAVEVLQRRDSPLATALDEPDQAAEALAMALRALRLEGENQAAVQLFAALENSIEADASVFAEVMYAHEALDKWTQVLESFRAMKRKGIQPNLYCYNSVLRACSGVRSYKRVLALLQDMRQTDMAPDAESYSAALDAIPGKWHAEVALTVFREMEGESVRPAASCYATAVRSCSAASLWEQSVQLFDQMRSFQMPIDPDTLWFALRACANCSSDLASKKLRELEADKRLNISEYHYDVVISACEREGRFAEVLALAARMGARGVNPHEITCNSVLTACVALGKWDVAANLFKTMRKGGANLDLVSYATVAKALLNASRWDDVLEIYEDLRSGDLGASPPGNAAGNAARGNGKASSATPDLGPDLAPSVIAALYEVGREEEARDLYHEALDRGWLRFWRRRRFGIGPALLDARGIPAQVVSIAVEAALEDAARTVASIESDAAANRGNALRRMAVNGLSPSGPQDILVVVDPGEIDMSSSAPQVRDPTSSSGRALRAAREALGEEAKLELTEDCVRIPGTELQALLVKRVKRAVSGYAPVESRGL